MNSMAEGKTILCFGRISSGISMSLQKMNFKVLGPNIMELIHYSMIKHKDDTGNNLYFLNSKIQSQEEVPV